MESAAEIDELRQAAEEGARRSGKILAERFGGQRTVEFKGGIDLVTDADKASEAELLAFIRSRFPEHAILAEESGARPGARYRWIVDPLDGTTNYVHRVPHFCVSIAVEGPSGLAAGCILDPLRGELFSAGRGRGAAVNGAPMHASDTADLHRALLCTGFPYDVREKPDAPLGLFNRLMKKAQGIRRMGSAALDLAYVACGRYDGFFEFGLKPWDIAAGSLLVIESGGLATRIDGQPLDLSCGDILACCPGMAPALQAETGRFLQEIRWRPGHR